MAIKRIKPVQDTFIVDTESGASFGGDEILELGRCYRPDATGCSRILLEFMTNEVEELLGDHSLVKATLHLKYAYSENLPAVYGIDVTEIEQEWTEGEGHVNDIPANESGANWKYARPGHPWEIEGGEDAPKEDDDDDDSDEDDDLFPCPCPCHPDEPEGDVIDVDMVKQQYFTSYQKNKDITIDVTEWVYNWIVGQGRGLGFLIKVTNEDIMLDRKARICFYSSETHTVNYPYLEIVYDDSKRPCDAETFKDVSSLIIQTRNLKEHYYTGEKARIDLLVRPEYPTRVFSTSSLYANEEKALPRNTLWGIRDEYTGEMWIPFTDSGTKLSFDEHGNYFILDTDLLEPERYYRLLFEVETKEERKVIDNKNIFRVTRYGEI